MRTALQPATSRPWEMGLRVRSMARICVLRQGYFPMDPRVNREVETLTESGHQVDVICQRYRGEPRRERIGDVNVYRLSSRRARRGVVGYLLEYGSFFLLSAVLVSALHVRRRFDLVQVNTLPDALVFAALVPRMFGASLLLDLHECSPEFFASRFQLRHNHPLTRVMGVIEQASIAFADSAITCTSQMREAFVARGAAPSKVGVVLNGADETIYDPSALPTREQDPDRFVLISHGTVEERYGLDTIIRAMGILRDDIPGLRLLIYGEGSYLDELRLLATELRLEDRVYFSASLVPLPDLLRAIASADAGVVAMKRDRFRDLTLCNKMYDFIAMKKPVIISRTRAVEEYYGDSCFLMFEPDDESDLARAIKHLHGDPELAQRLVRRADEVNDPYRWPRQREIYRARVEALLRGRERAKAGANYK
jgi:glycosyltransferase involved in cell wall biosynthesis